MKHITLEQKLRASSVTRWHIVSTAAHQTLADHSYRVAMITVALLKLFCETFLLNGTGVYRAYRARALDMALHHDVLEVLTGDMPTTYKDWLRNAGHNAIEPTHLMDQEYCEGLDESCRAYEPLVRALIKLADLIEAATFIRDYGIGDHAGLVLKNLNTRLAEVNDWMPRYTIVHEVLGVPCRLGRGWAMSDIHSDSGEKIVCWSEFVNHFMFHMMNAKPEEISDAER